MSDIVWFVLCVVAFALGWHWGHARGALVGWAHGFAAGERKQHD